MKNPNPWYVPPNSPAFDEPGVRASKKQSRSIDQDDEFDPDVMEIRARRLRAEISKICESNRIGVAYIAASMFLGDMLERYPRKTRKLMLDDTFNYLLKVIDR
jgi:hypothetical protein